MKEFKEELTVMQERNILSQAKPSQAKPSQAKPSQAITALFFRLKINMV